MKYKQRVNKNQQISNDLLEGVTDSSFNQVKMDISQKFAKVVEASNPSPRNPNFWERRFAAQKAQAPDSHGTIQKINRNIAPAEKSLSELMNVEVNEEDTDSGQQRPNAIDEEAEQANKSTRLSVGEIARCKLHCQQPGRTICGFCHGEGFEKAMAKRRQDTDSEKKEMQREILRLREQLEALKKSLIPA